MSDCIFCKIVQGEIPSIRVYEDEQTIAFLDINPTSEGHTLVIPRKHSADIYEIDAETAAAVMRTVHLLARRINAALHPDGLNVVQNNGRAAGQVIFHYHVHLIPRRMGDQALGHWHHESADHETLQRVAARIRNAGDE